MPHQALTFQNPHGQVWDHGEVLFESLPENIAVVVIVIQSPNLWHCAKPLKSLVVKLVYVGQVRVGQDNVGEFLHIPKAMGESVERIMLPRMSLTAGYKAGGRLT